MRTILVIELSELRSAVSPNGIRNTHVPIPSMPLPTDGSIEVLRVGVNYVSEASEREWDWEIEVTKVAFKDKKGKIARERIGTEDWIKF